VSSTSFVGPATVFERDDLAPWELRDEDLDFERLCDRRLGAPCLSVSPSGLTLRRRRGGRLGTEGGGLVGRRDPLLLLLRPGVGLAFGGAEPGLLPRLGAEEEAVRLVPSTWVTSSAFPFSYPKGAEFGFPYTPPGGSAALHRAAIASGLQYPGGTGKAASETFVGLTTFRVEARGAALPPRGVSSRVVISSATLPTSFARSSVALAAKSSYFPPDPSAM
jgi:hypothetical protein